MADAFNFCHKKGVVHADIKPSNIIIMKNFKEIRVIDFGIAKMAVLSSPSMTSEFTVGSPDYMAPEYIKKKKTDYLTDIYSFGLVMYKMISGGFPFDENDILLRLRENPLNISALVPEINQELSKIIMKCIQRESTNRFQTFDEIYNDLKSIN
jgi:serine/threonine-protein kinase